MVIREIDGFEDIDSMLSQSITTVVNAPGAPGAGQQSIPIVSLGPIQVMSRSGATIPSVTATIRTASTVLSTVSAPSGLFQATVDQSVVDQGAVIVFSAPGYLSTTVQAVGLICNRGTRNEMNQVVSMTSQNCSYPMYYLDPVQTQIPQQYPPTYAPGQYVGPTYPPPPPGYMPSPYGPPPGYAYGQPQQEVRYKSSDIPVEDRPRRPVRRPKPTKDETVPAPPSANPENQAVPAPPASAAPGIFALGSGMQPWLIAGGGLVAVGFLIWVIKS